MATLRPLPLFTLASALLFSAITPAQQATHAARIIAPIDETQLVTLKGNINPHANEKNDRGRVSNSLPMAEMMLVLSRTPEQQAAFDAYVQSEYDSGSANYHRWLTPRQIGQLYGPLQSDIATISGWLGSKGFTVTHVAPDAMSISFSGTAGQVMSAFHTEIHQLSVNGTPHIANMSDPQVPAALAAVVFGIKGLHNFLPHPMHRIGSKVQFNPDAHGWVKQQYSPGASLASGGAPRTTPFAAKPASSPKPNFYFPFSGANAVEEDVAPGDFAKIYNLPSGWPTSNNGSGQIITIIGTSDIDTSDVTNFKSAFGLPSGKTPVIQPGPDGDPGVCSGSTNICNDGDLEENSLDVEWSGAVAPGAQIVLVTDAYNSQQTPTNDPIFDGAQWVVDNAYVNGSAVSGSRVISISYGECELYSGTASNVAYNNLWQTAAGAGIAVFVATGDSGSPSCDDGQDSLYGYPYEAQYGLSVSGLASSPYNTAVGGTDFSWCQPTVDSSGNVQGCSNSNASTYWSTSNSASQASAKGYVPETPWNDTCESPIQAAYLYSIASLVGVSGVSTPEESCDFIYQDSLSLYFDDGDPMLAYYVDTVGGSGGASNCVVNTTDSATAGTCSSTDSSTGSTYGNLALANDGWPSPSWQMNSGVAGTSGLTQRAIPDVSFFAGDGSLDSATLICVSNDDAKCTNLSQTDDGNPADTGGAEEVGGTSVATPEMAGVMALINQKAGATQGSPNAELYSLAGKQTPSACSAETVNSNGNGSCYFQDVDQGTITMPCVAVLGTAEGGTVYDPSSGGWDPTDAVGGTVSPNCSTVNSGDAVGTLSGYDAAAGYDEASGLGSLNVANVVNADVWTTTTTGAGAASVAIDLSGVTSIDSTQSLSVAVTVSGSGSTPTGDVTLSASANGYSFAQTLSSGSTTFTIPANTFSTTGSVTLTATYSGDSNYALASATATVTVTATSTDSFTLSSISSPAAIAAGDTATATAIVTTTNGYAGTVTLNCSLTGQPSGATNLPNCSSSGTVSLSATSTSGSATLSVTTTPPTTSDLVRPALGNGRGGKWLGGGAVLAFLVFLGIPARRKSWRALMGAIVLLAGLGTLSACGGGGISTTTIPGTTAGTYTFTVTAVGSPAISASETQSFTVTVN